MNDESTDHEYQHERKAMKNGHGMGVAIIIAIGIAACGFFVGNGFYKGRSANRFVTVKGVSERNVDADLALWPLRFVATNDDLGLAQGEIEQSFEKVALFLKRHSIDPSAAERQRLEVTDVLANPYRSGTTGENRYIIALTVMVRSTDPHVIEEASQYVGELVEAGVVLSSQGGYDSGPTYLFRGLNDIKPEMIAEATAEARRSAEQFATDSGSRIGKIRRANQGVFVILPRDRAPGIMEGNQLQKTVRVVSTIEYFLRD
jgi:hypothetical protein